MSLKTMIRVSALLIDLTGFLCIARAQISSSFDYPGAIATVANGINSNGQIVGYYADAGGRTHGFLYGGGAFSAINDSSVTASLTQANGISDGGEVVGLYTLGCVFYQNCTGAYVDNGGSFTSIAAALGPNAEANGISGNGMYIVGAYGSFNGSNDFQHGFVDTGGVLTKFDYPGSTNTIPSGVNDSGQIVGTVGTQTGAH